MQSLVNTPASPSTSPSAGGSKWFALLGTGLGVFMSALDVSIVNISLPTLVKQLDTNFATIQWVVLSYVLVITSLMLGAARLGDMRDKKKLYVGGLALFTLGSLLCGLSPTVGWLIGFRAVQGLGATFTQALGIAIITEVFPSNERGRALGIMGSIVSVGIAIGPPIGGLLIGLVGWRAIFLVNVPVGVLAVLIILRFVGAVPPKEVGQRFDFVGAAILFVTLGGYALGMTFVQRFGFGDGLTIGLLVAAAIGLAVFVGVQTRTRQPMIDLRLFRNVLFSLNLLMGFLVFIMIASIYILPFYLELVQGYSTQQVGLLIMVFPAVMGVVAPVAGVLSDRFGSRVISLIGLLVIVGGCLALGTLTTGVTPLGFILRLAPLGLGVGMFQSPNNSAVMGAAPPQRLGIAAGLLALTRNLGQTTGLPLLGAIFTAFTLGIGQIDPGADVTSAPPDALVNGVTSTYRFVALVILVATTLAALALWIDTHRQAEMVEQAAD